MSKAQEKVKQEQVELDKATYVAYCSLENLHVTPVVKENGRVNFRVKGNVGEVLAKLQSNPSVKLLDYLNKLELVRSLIFTLKGNGYNGKHK